MDPCDLLRAIQAGKRPSGPIDYRPYTDKVQSVFDFLQNKRLLCFRGSLDERFFIPVDNIEHATSIAYEPPDEDFHWEEDGQLVWDNRPAFVFEDRQVWTAFAPNFKEIAIVLSDLVRLAIPNKFRNICSSLIGADLDEIVGCLAKFGQLDQFYGLVWEAYQQGGWPCGLTGPRPDEHDELRLQGRKMFVYWEKT